MAARFLTCLACSALLAACTPVYEATPHRANAQLLTIAEPLEPAGLNPMLSADLAAGYYGPIVFSYLFAVDQNNKLVPDLATSVPVPGSGISADGLTFTYHLRLGVRWQDGVPLTARDVVFSYRAVMNPANNVASRSGYDQIASISAPDDRTVRVRLKRKYAPFVATFFVAYPILPEHVLRSLPNLNHAAYNVRPLGSGPYRVTEWIHGDRITFAANPSYWRGKPKIDRIIMRFVPSTETLLTQLRTHEADVWFGAAASAYPQLRALPGYSVSFQTVNGVACLDLNLRDPILRDARVRRAFALALDRARIIRTATHGVYLVTDSDQTPMSWAFDRHGPTIPYDPGAARRLLDRAGWRMGSGGVRERGGEKLQLELAYVTGFSTATSIGAQIAQQARSVGFDVTQKTYSQALLWGTAQQGGVLATGRYQIALDIKATAGVDPDDSNLWRCDQFPPYGFNYAFWCDRRVDAALQDAISTYDVAQRRRDYQLVQRRLVVELPVIFLYRGREIIVYPASLHGVVRSASISDFWSVWQWHFE